MQNVNLKLKIIKLKNNKDYQLIFDKKGEYIVYFENYSGKIELKIKKENVNVKIYGLYIGKKKDKFNLKTIQHHIAPNSSSDLLVKGVFYDESFFIYDGLIRIEKDAQKSHAYQKNQNLLMSEKAKVISNPNLEILANDVFCTHGSTTGFLNEDEIFYIQTKGVERKKAEELLVEGFINEIKEKIL